jgi:hypothetical protein
MNKIKEDLKVKQAMKEAEQKKKGFYPSYHSFSPCIALDLMIFLLQCLQTKSKMLVQRQQSRPRSKLTRKREQRSSPEKRLCAMASLCQIALQVPLLHPHLLPLLLQLVV